MKNKLLYYQKLLLLCLLLCCLGTSCGEDDEGDIGLDKEIEFNGIALLGSNERPAVTTAGAGEMDAVYDDVNNTLRYTITWQLGNPDDATTAMHFHGPADVNSSAPPVVTIEGFDTDDNGNLSGTTRKLTQEEEDDLKAGLWYLNIHSTSHPAGELRGNLVQ
ncbi:CHRD domain-containing protein [Pontibacter anaerobius]|uniref:CHRD domain-containing protein n=1 Tax=Pontibacter anaerobius TaxID=2993940 RepID=A0ABT3R9Z8_9BACT|nr:CHRD domain-containing protein [Pontibacter anaerobius]MCX2738331.1 CHRD domain-containing protein [Pontibacter anaerobius]